MAIFVKIKLYIVNAWPTLYPPLYTFKWNCPNVDSGNNTQKLDWDRHKLLDRIKFGQMQRYYSGYLFPCWLESNRTTALEFVTLADLWRNNWISVAYGQCLVSQQWTLYFWFQCDGGTNSEYILSAVLIRTCRTHETTLSSVRKPWCSCCSVRIWIAWLLSGQWHFHSYLSCLMRDVVFLC